MLQATALSIPALNTPAAGSDKQLEDVSFSLPAGHLLAVIGAADSGRGQLLQLLAGLRQPSAGSIHGFGTDLSSHALPAGQLGYVVPAESSLHGLLTVRETLMSAHFLRVAVSTLELRVDRVSHLLVVLGLETVAARRVAQLSLAQQRRLMLGLALVTDAPLLLCDEMTAGLDVRSQQELVALLKFVAEDLPGRIVIHATETLGNLASYDSVLVLHEGRVCFHGPPRALAHYFSISTVDELYPRLAQRPAERWGESWSRHRESYYQAFQMATSPATSSAKADDEAAQQTKAEEPISPPNLAKQPATAAALPSLAAQTLHLLSRRWTLWRRHQVEWLEHLALFILCPVVTLLLVSPNTGYLSAMRAGHTSPEALWPAAYTCSMVLLIQGLMITLIGLRTGFREIAAERVLFERERIAGLRVGAFLAAKLGFLIPLITAHGAALVLLAELTGASLPGHALLRLALIMLTGISFGSLCLGLSATSRSPESAENRAWKLWTANLLFSGALLGFPRPLGTILQPFLTLFQGWSGSIDTLAGLPVFVPLTQWVRTGFATPGSALTTLLLHAVAGIALASWGLKRRRLPPG